MGALFEYKGIVKKLLPVQTFASGFEKRDLVLTDDVGEVVKWPNIICFTFKKERMQYLDGIREGMRVKVVFAIDGREWSDGAGKVRYFTDLTGIKLDVLAGSEAEQGGNERGAASAELTPPEVPSEIENGVDDLPF